MLQHTPFPNFADDPGPLESTSPKKDHQNHLNILCLGGSGDSSLAKLSNNLYNYIEIIEKWR